MKSILNQTKLNLIKKIKKEKEKGGKSTERKESELLCFQNNRIKPSDVPLSLAVYPEKLQKIVTSKNSIEIDRVHARILSNHIVQKTINELKSKYGTDIVEKFLKSNEKRHRKTAAKRIIDETAAITNKKEKPVKVDSTIKEDKKISKSKKSSKVKLAIQNENNDQPSKAERSADPFFFDSSGQAYLASVTTAASESESDSEDKAARNNKKANRNTQFSGSSKFKKNSIKDTKEPSKIQRNDVEMKEPAVEEPIHPSWKAKQQMKKMQIQEFQGTKIKFNDDD